VNAKFDLDLDIGRTTVPQHGLLVLNRNGMNNFIRHLTPGTELDIQGQIVHVSGGDEKHDGELRLQAADSTDSVTIGADKIDGFLNFLTGIYGLWFAGGEPEAQRLIDVMNQSVSKKVALPTCPLRERGSRRIPLAWSDLSTGPVMMADLVPRIRPPHPRIKYRHSLR
jgi:hypothetical protein